MLLPTMVATLNSWAIIVAERNRPPESAPARVATPLLADLVFDHHADPTGLDHEPNNGEMYTGFLNEGLALLKQHSASTDRIVCLCFSNPFPYALQRIPARGGSPFFEYTTNFTDAHMPTPSRILGDAEVVLYPKGRSKFGKLEILLNACAPLLKDKYRIAGESENWTLFQKL
jgi:hypothetical protein